MYSGSESSGPSFLSAEPHSKWADPCSRICLHMPPGSLFQPHINSPAESTTPSSRIITSTKQEHHHACCRSVFDLLKHRIHPSILFRGLPEGDHQRSDPRHYSRAHPGATYQSQKPPGFTFQAVWPSKRIEIAFSNGNAPTSHRSSPHLARQSGSLAQ